MRRDARQGADDRGEIFVETIIAAAIVAASVGMMFQAIADSGARERAIEMRREAVLVAQSAMADIGAEIPVRAGRTAGLAGDLVWRVDISRYDDEVNSAGALWRVNVSVAPRAGGADLARFETLRLGRED